MNITQLVNKKYGYVCDDSNSCIHINHDLFMTDPDHHITLDKELYIDGTCTLYNTTVNNVINATKITVCDKVSINSIINTSGLVFIVEYNRLMYGTFIGGELYDISSPHINHLIVNGYVMHNGVLS